MSKFNAIKHVIDGLTFDSGAEAKRYGQLRLLERAREIKALAVHPKFPLRVDGVLIGHYSPDFVYFEAGRRIAEDVKGVMTPAASLRMRIFKALFPEYELRTVINGVSKEFKQRRVSADVQTLR